MPSSPSFPSSEVAKRLHGTVAQQLTAASMIVHVLTERLEARGAPEASMAKDLLGKLGKASTELRDIMKELAGGTDA
jgi:signal transduction histidine kinase